MKISWRGMERLDRDAGQITNPSNRLTLESLNKLPPIRPPTLSAPGVGTHPSEINSLKCRPCRPLIDGGSLQFSPAIAFCFRADLSLPRSCGLMFLQKCARDVVTCSR